MKKSTKKLLILPFIGLISSITLAACSAKSSFNQQFFDQIAKDQTAVALKTELAGYSKDALEIVANKQEIATQSKEFIETFNRFYDTKLTFTQVGGVTDYGQFLNAKFANGPRSVLILGAGSLGGFKNIAQHLIDTPASTMLKNDNTTEGQFVVDGKHFMPQAVESFGIIYNKDVFARANITVHEGKSFKDINPNGTEPMSFNGVEEKNNSGGTKTYNVYTSDLKKEGFEKINQVLESNNIKPFYSTAKTEASNIWPITNHLLGVVSAAQTGLKQDNVNLTNADQVLTDQVLMNMQQALNIYGQDKPYTLKTNTVDLAMQNVAVGQFAMTQNGTWSINQILDAKKDAKIGFMPMPAFDKDTQKAKLARSISQRWGVTTTGNDPAKLKTAKLFFQFLYQTKSGVEFALNKMQLLSPFKQIPGLDQNNINDPLLRSATNYTKSTDVVSAIDNYFPNGFNNSDPVLRKVTNEGYKNTTTNKTELIAEWNKLKENEKKQQTKK
ncbi:Extracellular solute-binding protein [[Mycoplasma] cavipharyngis]|uniref:extracellular solute-binding protein n=1 Tax=[Mycoplasma] cavipharyngis TaxID=92757 RepID=UPI003704B038